MAKAPSPPAAGSKEHAKQLEAVRQAVAEVTPYQRERIDFWAGSIGSPTPAGIWLGILAGKLQAGSNDVEHAVYMLTLASIAMFDASIGCWQVKYTHWFPRPSNSDPNLRAWLHVPNFPSYSSAHSSFSWALATSLDGAGGALGLPLDALASEASETRVWAGIHYPADCEGGRTMGIDIGSRLAQSLPSLAAVARAAV
jgi:hypothetical protein